MENETETGVVMGLSRDQVYKQYLHCALESVDMIYLHCTIWIPRV